MERNFDSQTFSYTSQPPSVRGPGTRDSTQGPASPTVYCEASRTQHGRNSENISESECRQQPWLRGIEKFSKSHWRGTGGEYVRTFRLTEKLACPNALVNQFPESGTTRNGTDQYVSEDDLRCSPLYSVHFSWFSL